jgi:hypothetical protein
MPPRVVPPRELSVRSRSPFGPMPAKDLHKLLIPKNPNREE